MQVGQFVRLKLRRSFRPLEFEDEIYEGLITSILFDKNFEVSYVEDEKPISHWFSLKEVYDLEVL